MTRTKKIDPGQRIRDQRDRELNRPTLPPLAGSFEADLVGMSFQADFPKFVFDLEEQIGLGDGHWSLEVHLRREPDNEYDPNCIAVDYDFEHLEASVCIGKITKSLAARLAPELDAGIRWYAFVSAVRVDRDHPDHPGITIDLTRRPS